LTARDGASIPAYSWRPPGDAKALVTIAHGLSEHAARYDAFANALTSAGYAVYAEDHRGHGAHARENGSLGDFGAAGYEAIVEDLAVVCDAARTAHPNTPLFFFGHSMGSVLAQRFVQVHGKELAGAVFCGTFGAIDGLDAILGMADAAAQGTAGSEPSTLQGQMFAGFNTPFEPKTTGFEWLSRDKTMVRAYADDPLCGFPLTNAAMASMLHGFANAWNPENEAHVPKALPVLVVAGADDPAGAATGSLQALVARYRSLGVADLSVSLYPDARHEILNETNRDDVYRDLIAWFDAHLPA
jgi:alpha-beta hydrolase superfamily lysophospholipase